MVIERLKLTRENNVSVSIRVAKKDDIGSIVRLLGELQTVHIIQGASETEKKYIQKKSNAAELWKSAIERSLQNSSELLLVAEVDGDVIGYLKADIKQRSQVHQQDKKIYIRFLIVSEKHRNHGIGTQLIKEVEKFAKAKNTPFITLKTSPKNKSTRDFYKSLGFEEIYVEMIKGV